jgi:hypothetical protein
MRDVIEAMEFAKCQKQGENDGRPRWCSCKKRGFTTAKCLDSDDISEWKAALRAALVAMREPSDAMCAAAEEVDQPWEGSYSGPTSAGFHTHWTAMIDAALTELDAEAPDGR